MKTTALRYHLIMSYHSLPASKYGEPVSRTNTKIFKTMAELLAWKAKHAPFLDDPNRLEKGITGKFTYHITRQ